MSTVDGVCSVRALEPKDGSGAGRTGRTERGAVALTDRWPRRSVRWPGQTARASSVNATATRSGPATSRAIS